MSAKSEFLPIEEPEHCKAWLLSFDAYCRSHGIKDEKKKDECSPKTDKFIERCGTKTLLKVMTLLPGKDISELSYSELSKAIIEYIEPRQRLTIADRTNFLQISQQPGEPVVDFLTRLNAASEHCHWESLDKNPTDELIRLRFIAGLSDDKLKLKVLEKLHLTPNCSVKELVDFCQMQAQLTEFIAPSVETRTDNFHVDKNFSRPCKNCGRAHAPKSCPAYGKTCHGCGKQNHFMKFCRQKPRNQNADRNQFQRFQSQKADTNSLDVYTVDVNYNANSSLMRHYTVMNRSLSFQLDTGAEVSIMSSKQWEKLGSPPLRHSNLHPTNFDGSQLTVLGELKTQLSSLESTHHANFIVVRSDKEYGLIGRNIIDEGRSTIHTFAVDTEYLPTIKGFTASVTLVDDSKPLKFCKARNVPLHLKETLDKELDILMKQGVITPTDHSTHASPVVWAKKANGRFRMCVDFKATLNSNIQSDAYPLPTTEEIFSRVGKACKFAKLDLKSAYSQIALDEHAKQLSVINTHKGLFTVNRLQMGMKNASAIFQRCIEQILRDIPGIIVYQDDVMLCAESQTQLKKRLSAIKSRLRDHCVSINDAKCIESADELKFLGFIFSNNSIKPDPELTCKIRETKIPQNDKELASFLGLVNYYGRFIPNFAELCAPLHAARETLNKPFC